ncbi:MAG: hypothetical protein OXR68_04390 [Alphaproteobacteria bacterium]|nr:hypothetical protein [Alphaproteobacteria bacterium]MDD9919847.1 hypothetical protein [Alphaproteobacteria bacterium]
MQQSALIIIDNTNILNKDWFPYKDMAEKYNYAWEILQPNTPWAWNVKTCYEKNQHNVPLKTIQKMADAFEAYPTKTSKQG